jgi:hypothetical protein
VSTEVHILAVVDDEVLGSARVAGALVSAVDNRVQKVIMGSVAVVIAVAAPSAACNIQYE